MAKQVFTSLEERLPKETVAFFQSAGADEIDKGILRADNDGPFNKLLRKWFMDEHGIDLSTWHTMNVGTKEKVLSICATNEGNTLAVAIKTFFKGAPWFNALPTVNQDFILSALDLVAV